MNIQFSNATDSPEQFFNMLPEDWQVLIVPYWKSYKDVAKIYVLKENEEVVAGGLVFSKSLPDMSDFERAQLFQGESDKGSLRNTHPPYISELENHRGSSSLRSSEQL